MCYFHFLQALRKHLREEHILTLLATNAKFASFIHLFYSLPYVPTDRVIEVYEGVILARLAILMKSNHPDIVSNLGNIKKWVSEYTWVGQRQDCSRGSGLFPLVE